MMEFVQALGFFCVFATVLLFSSGWSTCLSIKKNGSKYVSPYPFIFGLLCAYANYNYGLAINDQSIIYTNFFGILCQIFFVLYYFYHYYNKLEKKFVATQASMITLFVISYHVFLNIKKHDANLTDYLGYIASIMALMFFASPLLSLVTIIKAKSVQSLSFLFSMLAFIVSSGWFFYGKLLGNLFIQVPNFIGMLISGFQLYLFYHYKDKKAYEQTILAL